MTALSDTMAEATRLTRAGRLAEALSLLRAAPPKAGFDATPCAPPAGGAEGRPGSILNMVRTGEQPGAPWALPGREAKPSAPRFGQAAQMPAPEALRDLLAGLATLGGQPDLGRTPFPSRPRPPLPVPAGARFDECSYANEAGTRSYKLYVSSRLEAAPALIVMLHGCTQSPDDFAAGTRMNELAEERGFLVVYPEQPQSANASRCWNWFRTGDQGRDAGEPSLIAGITRDVIRDFGVDAARVFAAGLSAGGAAAAVMGSAYPDLYAAVGIHSGLACGAASDMPSAFAAMKHGGTPARARRTLRTIVFHGDGDRTVSPANGDQVIQQSAGGGEFRTVRTEGRSVGGARYTRTVHSDESGRPMLEQWLVHGGGHAWYGGSGDGSYTDPTGPDASREMLRFFLDAPAGRG
jgi:poly(hydroxyalkanoate) depolymerase family esterase